MKSSKDNKLNINKLSNIIKYFSIFIIVLIIALIVFNYDKLTVENIIKYTPKNNILAILLILFLYVIKSISIILPSAILYVATGKLFSLPKALIINSLGLILMLSVPYLIGKFLGSDLIDAIVDKYPKVEKVISFKDNSPWFFVIMTRIVKVVPGDIASMLLGSMNIEFILYLVLSFIVRFPPMLANTFLGVGIQTSNFTGFFISTGFTIIIAVVSNIIYFKNNKKTAFKN